MVERERVPELRSDVCYLLDRVGAHLIENPKSPRPLRTFVDRLGVVAAYSEDPDLMLLDSYLSMFTEDLFFNVLTDVSALVEPTERDDMLRSLGQLLRGIAEAVAKGDEGSTYRHLRDLAFIWGQRIPKLHRTQEPVEPAPKDVQLPPAFAALTQYPAKKSSEHYLASGLPSTYHIDLDFVTVNTQVAKDDNLVGYYAAKIDELQKESRIDKLAFFDKPYGPVGAIALAYSIVSETKIDPIFVRLRRRSPFDQVKTVVPVRDGDRIVIVSDVATTGGSIARAAEIIRRSHPQAKITDAIVIYDREQRARERLAGIGVRLEAIRSRGDLGEPEEEAVPPTDEVVPLSREEQQELENAFGKEVTQLLRHSYAEL